MGSFGDLYGPGLVSTALNTAGSLINTGVSYNKQQKLLRYQNQLSQENATTAYNRQLEFWNKQNAYNTPAAERGRLEQAGLNPALMYSGSGSTTPAQGLSSVPEASAGSAPSVATGQFSNPLDDAMKAAQIRNIEANTRKIEGDTHDSGETIRGQSLQNDLLAQNLINAQTKNELDRFDLTYKEATRESDISKLDQSVTNMRKQAEVLDAQLQNEIDKHSNNPTVVEDLRSRIFLNNKQAAMLEVQAQLARKNIEVADTAIWKSLNETANIRQLSELIDQQIRTEGATADLRKAQAMLESIKSGAADSGAGRVLAEFNLILHSLLPFYH